MAPDSVFSYSLMTPFLLSVSKGGFVEACGEFIEPGTLTAVCLSE